MWTEIKEDLYTSTEVYSIINRWLANSCLNRRSRYGDVPNNDDTFMDLASTLTKRMRAMVCI